MAEENIPCVVVLTHAMWCAQLKETNSRLGPLKSSTKLITAAERQAVEKGFTDAVREWAKRKRIFKNIWWVCLANLLCTTGEPVLRPTGTYA